MRKLVSVLTVAMLTTLLFVTPARAADLFPDIDIIPDPNLEDLNDFPDADPNYGPGKRNNRRDRHGNGIPDRKEARVSDSGGKGSLHRRHRDGDDDDANEDQYDDEGQYAAHDQYIPPEDTVRSAAPADISKKETSKRTKAEPISDNSGGNDDGGGFWGYVVGAIVLLFLLGGTSGRRR